VTNAGINKYLFEMANIRNQCSWVHGQRSGGRHGKSQGPDPHGRGQGGAASAPEEPELSINPKALIIGGGVAGMTAARTAFGPGIPQRSRGTVRHGWADRPAGLHETWEGGDVQAFLKQMIERSPAMKRSRCA
jgi:heterodisulfide reductase subunit A2